jgi:hypothetical protein
VGLWSFLKQLKWNQWLFDSVFPNAQNPWLLTNIGTNHPYGKEKNTWKTLSLEKPSLTIITRLKIEGVYAHCNTINTSCLSVVWTQNQKRRASKEFMG